MAQIVTGEAVALELPPARFPSRIAALLIDMLVQIVVLSVAIGALFASAGASSDYAAAAAVAIFVLVIVGYPTAFETLSRGKTLGKLALGLRVVGDDGSPVRFRQALVRGLTGVIEIWSLAPIALICSIASDRGKRVGDFFAGTYVVQERAPARQALPGYFAVVPPPLAGWAQSLHVSGLSAQTAEAAGSYLRRFGELHPAARDALGVQLANAVAAEVSPPPPVGTPPAAYLAAVLAVRRQHEQASYGPRPTESAGDQAPWLPGTSFPPGPPAPLPPGQYQPGAGSAPAQDQPPPPAEDQPAAAPGAAPAGFVPPAEDQPAAAPGAAPAGFVPPA
jgi:uncharacterized RDD family membrane protein YckC